MGLHRQNNQLASPALIERATLELELSVRHSGQSSLLPIDLPCIRQSHRCPYLHQYVWCVSVWEVSLREGRTLCDCVSSRSVNYVLPLSTILFSLQQDVRSSYLCLVLCAWAASPARCVRLMLSRLQWILYEILYPLLRTGHPATRTIIDFASQPHSSISPRCAAPLARRFDDN